MWKILIIILIFSSCSVLKNPEDNVKRGLTPLFQSIDDAAGWVHTYLTYKSDIENYGVVDYWASPEETFDRKTGDCEDYAILMMYCLWDSFGIKSELRCTDSHAVVWYNKIYYDCVAGKNYPDYPDIKYIYLFDTVMERVYTTH